jgi:RNA-directed DNA polymerase
MQTNLTRTPDEIRELFNSLKTFSDIANILEVESGYLNFILFKIPLDERYKIFEISKKRGGKRTIHAPIPPIKIVQQKLNDILYVMYNPRCSAHAYIKYEDGKSPRNIVSNANFHSNKMWVFNLDLKDFFPSIHYGRVRGLFMKGIIKLPYDVANNFARICCYNDGLPQGAPTSPIISNMICNKMDSRLLKVATKNRCHYTRYADDITFSTNQKRFPKAIVDTDEEGHVNVGLSVLNVINKNKFKINTDKTHLQHKSNRQLVTGLVVNKFPNVNRKYVRNIRAMLHNWEKSDYDTVQKRYLEDFAKKKHRYPDKSEPRFLDFLRGKIEYLGMVRRNNRENYQHPIYRSFMIQFQRLAERDLSIYIELPFELEMEISEDMTDKTVSIFISYASEDRKKVDVIYQRLENKGYAPWMDKHSLIAGKNWKRSIEKAIKDCDFFLLCLSKNTDKDGFIQHEIRDALDMWKQKRPDSSYILPIRLEACEAPYEIEDIQWIDYFEKDWWNKLMQAINIEINK